MTIINIKEMNNEQLTEVFNANNKLEEKVLDDMIESEMFWIGEQLDYIRSAMKDWSIGPDNRSYITVRDSEAFIEGVIVMDESVPLFSDKNKVIIYDTKAKFDEYRAMEEPQEEDFEDEEGELDEEAYNKAWEAYDNAEEQIEELVRELAEEVVYEMVKRLEYCYDSEARLDYFLEFYAHERLDDNYYIDTTNTDNPYELFQDVAYTKSFK
jgi:hypothetical protein